MLDALADAATFEDKFKIFCFLHYENHIYKIHLIELEEAHPELLARLKRVIESREEEFRAFFKEAK
jgi:hypothetical protein